MRIPVFLTALGLSASAMLMASGQAFAQAEPIEEVSAETSLDIAGTSISAQLPCDAPLDRAISSNNGRMLICEIDGLFFVIGVAEGDALVGKKPMGSDFDLLKEDVGDSPHTVGLTELLIEDRRVLRAGQGPDPRFGALNAIEVVPGAMAYAIAVTRPGSKSAVSPENKAKAERFVASLKVGD